MEKKIKEQSRFRLWFQAAWFVLTNAYLRGYTKGKIYTGPTKVLCVPGLNCYSCPGALGACPMGALQAVLGDASYRVSLYVFGLIAAFGVLFGRLICGWLCPFGLVQDLLYRIKVKNKKKNLPGHKYLKHLRYVILVVFPLLLVSVVLALKGATSPWFCEWICPSGTLLGGIPLVLLNAGLRAAAGFRFAWKLFLLVVILSLAVFYCRPFCKYLCPLGALYGLFNPISSYRLVVDKDKCVSCGTCQRVCGMDIKTFQTPNSPDCIRCGKCMAACPTGAIDSTWRRFGRSAKARFFVDDEAAPEAETLHPTPGRAIWLGLLMIAGALSCGSVNVVSLYNAFWEHAAVEYYQQVNALYIPMEIILLLACVLVLVTGVYALRCRAEPARLRTLHEKIKLAGRVALLGLIVGIVGLVKAFGTLGLSFSPMMLEPVYVLVGIPLLLPLCTMLKKTIEGQKTSLSGWVFLYAIGCALAASPWVINAWLNSISEG